MPKDPTKNHDLQELTVLAIENTLDQVIKGEPGGWDGVKLLKSYRVTIRARLKAVQIDEIFKGTWEQTIPSYFKARVEEFSAVKALTPEIWRHFLTEHGYDALNKDQRLALDMAATALHNDLPKHLVGIYRDAIENYPMVYVAIQTALLQEIWAAVSNVDKKVDGMAGTSQEILSEIRKIGETIAAAYLDAMRSLVEESSKGEVRLLIRNTEFPSSETLRIVMDSHADTKELLRR